jgi:hypothetical protein
LQDETMLTEECGAMGRHIIWQQGLAINESRLAIVQSRSKVQITGAG